MTDSTTKNTKNFFDSSQSGLDHLFHKIKERDILNKKVLAYLPENIRSNYQVSNLNSQGKLVIITIHASAAMELNYRIPDLLRQFQNDPELKRIKQIQCKIDPNSQRHFQEAAFKSSSLNLSKESAELILEIARTLSDPQLRKIMEKIAAHAQKN